MIIAGVSFMIVNFFVKLLGSADPLPFFGKLQSFPAHELILARSIVSFAISYYIIKKTGGSIWGNNKKWLFVRGLAGIIALTLFFWSIQKLPLVLASILQYLSPIFTAIFGIILLKDRVRLIQWICIFLSLAGVIVISFDKLLAPTISEDLSFTWIGLSILSAAFSGLAYTAIVKMKHTDSAINIVIYFPMMAIPVMTIWCLFEFKMPKGIEWLFLLIIGIFTQIAQVMMTKAFHVGPTNVVAPIQYLGAIYAFLIGYFFWDETLTYIVTIGIFITLIGLMLNSLVRN